MVKILITMIAAVVISLPSAAQQERKFIRGGNDLFNKQDFEKAEVEYRKALDTEVKSYEGAFNLGDALYKQKKFDEALQQFQSLAQTEKDKEKLGELYHNIGNTLLAMNKLYESIEAYKQSLRNRPNSQETKYNLAFARKQQQDHQNQDQNKDQNKDQQDQNKDQQNQDQNKDQNKDENKDQNQDQNKDQQDQNKDQQDKDKQDQDQKDQQNKDQQNKDQQNKDQQQQDQQAQPKISQEDAKRLLEALEADEKKTQEKVQKDKVQAQKAKKMKIEKNW